MLTDFCLFSTQKKERLVGRAENKLIVFPAEE